MTLLLAPVQGHLGTRQHLAFRSTLHTNAPLQAAISAVKGTCAAPFTDGGAGHGARISKWIAKAKALESYR
jgi:GrpB-like predicted nucleotidyltransferase (UPF0157 family)